MPPIVSRDPSSLPPDLRERLVKVCGPLGSQFDGERAAAALKASELLRRHGLTWHDAIRPASVALARVPPNSNDADWRRTLTQYMRCTARLSQWEVQFLRGLSGFNRLSDKQAARLSEIAAKAGVAS